MSELRAVVQVNLTIPFMGPTSKLSQELLGWYNAIGLMSASLGASGGVY
jgi:hypothetical protein